MNIGDRVLINDKAPFFKQEEAAIAYIGTEGISVYLINSKFDDCIPLKDGEYDLL